MLFVCVDTPRNVRSTMSFSPARSLLTIGLMRSMAIAKPMLLVFCRMAVFMPITSPLPLTSGPPELPGLIAASVWMRSCIVSPLPPSIVRPTADTMPDVTVGPPGRASAWPMATTFSPTVRSFELPSTACGRSVTPSTFTRATSLEGSRPITFPSRTFLSAKETLIDVALSITGWLVRM